MNLNSRICLLLVCALGCSILGAQDPPQPSLAQPQAPVEPQEPENIERMFSIGLYDWLPNGGPRLRTGSLAFVPPPHNLELPQKPSRAYGVIVTIPTKGSTRLELSYLTMNDRGNTLAPTDLGLFGAVISQNEPLATAYSFRHFKASWNYLTYPNPPQDAKFRIKTLWEFHYMQIKPSVEATAAAPGQLIGDSQRVLLPAVGLGAEYVPSRHFRLEARGSGMGFPHKSGLWDAEGTAVVRLGSLEIFAGAKALHFKTSPKQETFIQGTLWGPFGGLRWVFR